MPKVSCRMFLTKKNSVCPWELGSRLLFSEGKGHSITKVILILEEWIFIQLLIECLLGTILRSRIKQWTEPVNFPSHRDHSPVGEMDNQQMHVKCQGNLSYVKKDKTKQRKERRGYNSLCRGDQGKRSSDILLHEKTPQHELIKIILLSSLKSQYCLGSSRWFFCSSQISAGLQGPAAWLGRSVQDDCSHAACPCGFSRGLSSRAVRLRQAGKPGKAESGNWDQILKQQFAAT